MPWGGTWVAWGVRSCRDDQFMDALPYIELYLGSDRLRIMQRIVFDKFYLVLSKIKNL